jgi:CTD small phosphatase-like protein 2
VLILDIDETMIHCLDDRDPENEEPDVVIKVPLDEEGEYADAGINIRPHLYECLKQFNQHYQVIAFTASDQSYANAILDFIDPDRELIDYRLYRQHCLETEFGYIKDLRIIANRDMKDMVLVDNSVLSFAL